MLAPPPAIRRSTLRLAGAQAIVSATIPLNATLGSVAAAHLSHHDALSGTSVGVALLTSMVALWVAGRRADRMGRRPVLAAGLVLIAVGSVVVGIGVAAESFAVFLLGTAIFGLGSGPALLCRAAAADLYPASLRGRGVGAVVSAGAVGSVAGPLLAAGAETRGDELGLEPSAVPWLGVPLFAALAVWLILTVRPDPRDVAARLRDWYPSLPPDPPLRPARPRGVLVRLPAARVAIATLAVVQAAMVGVMAVVAVELDDQGHGSAATGALMSAHFIGMFAFSVPIGGLADRIGRRRTITAGALVAAVGAVGTSLAPEAVLMLPFFFLLGVGWCGCFVGGTAVLADATAPNERGTLTSMNDQVVALAGAGAALSAGPVLSVVGFWAVGLVLGVAAAAAALVARTLPEVAPGRYADDAVGAPAAAPAETSVP